MTRAVERWLRATFLAALAFGGVTPLLHARAAELTARDVYSRSIGAVCTIISGSSGKSVTLGTGFVTSADGQVATNFHVVDGASEIFVKCGERVPVRGQLVRADKTVDLAVVQTNIRVLAPLTISDADPGMLVGQPVYVIGSPQGLEGTISNGLISGMRQRNGAPLIQISAPISHGSSGGPVILSNGSVIGVATAVLEEGQNLNFAVPAVLLRSLANVAGPQTPGTPELKSAGLSGWSPPNLGREPNAGDFEAACASTAFWSSIDWNSVDAHRLVQTLYEVEPFDIPEGSVQRNEEISFNGARAGMYLLRLKRSANREPGLLLKVGTGASPQYCRAAGARLDAGLGAPTVSNEITFRVDDRRFVTYVRKQWDIPPSRVFWECRSIEREGADEGFGLMTILGQHHIGAPRDSPFTWIRCVVTMQTTMVDPMTRRRNVSPPEAQPDVVLAIDEMKKRVYEEGRGPAGDAELSDAEIRLVQKWGSRTDEVTIDRRTGAYFEKRSHSSGLVHAEVSGTCSSFNPGAKKF